jgi:hypothetical protein
LILPKKRRFALYKSLPLLVAIVLLLVAKLAALQRADVIANLTDRLEQGSTAEATAAVRQLGAMPHPPLSTLVSAATHSDHEIADEAQLAISRVLRRCQRDIGSKRHVRSVARQLDELAELLDSNKRAFSPQDQEWLAATAGKILRLSNRCSVGQTPLVAVHCDAIIETAAANKSADPPAESLDSPAIRPTSDDGRTPTQEPDGRDAGRARLEREFDAYASQQKSAPQLNDQSNRQMAGGSQSKRRPSRTTTAKTPDGTTMDEDADTAVLTNERQHDTSWSQPVLRYLPAAPLAPSPAVSPVARTPGSNTLRIADANATREKVADVPSRELIERWLSAQGFEASALKEALADRDFEPLHRQLAERLVSHDPRERMQLVDDVLTTPDINSRPWLTILADDSDADVRLAAVTIMATSSDPALIEKAWQTAIRDRDPRIADLATRLRDRRMGTQRR